MFQGNKRLDGRDFYFHNTTHLETDLEAQWFLKPRTKFDCKTHVCHVLILL